MIFMMPNYLNSTFDIVFTSYGVLGWLPCLEVWSSIISRYLNPEGLFVMVEFHPVVWIYDHHFNQINYSYFNRGPIIEKESVTYGRS